MKNFFAFFLILSICTVVFAGGKKDSGSAGARNTAPGARQAGDAVQPPGLAA
jgi:hypothetical protein